MITKFARLEFELFTKPSNSDFFTVSSSLVAAAVDFDNLVIILKACEGNTHTQNTKHETRNTKHQTQNTKHT